jgi:nucleoside-diphosphate-sugar epimerase
MMRIAVTGSAGRLGRRTVEMLTRAGHEVLPIDARVPQDGSAPDTRVVNLTVYEGLTDLLAGSDAIVHLGNFPGFGRSGRAQGFSNNITATNNVFQAADELKIARIVYASSLQVYGCFGGTSGPDSGWISPRYLPLDEDHPLLPADAYPLSKAAGEWVAEAFCRRRAELTVWSLRFTAVCVPRGPAPPTKAPREVPLHMALRGSLFSWIHLDDAVRAILLGCQAERPGHTPVNIVAPHSSDPWSVEMLRAAYGAVPEFRRAITPQEPLVSGERAGQLLGFRAERTLEDLCR